MQEGQEETVDTTPKLDKKIDDAINEWWGSVAQTMGPLISTSAFTALSVTRDNLKTVLTTATN